MKPKFLALLLTLFLVPFLLAGCGEEEATIQTVSQSTVPDCPTCVIDSVEVATEYTAIPYVGDLWPVTWADNDKLYTAFGDGTGMDGCYPTLLLDEPDEFDEAYNEVTPGCFVPKEPDNEYCQVFGECSQCRPQCLYTPVGLVELTGPVPDFAPCDGSDQCVVSRHIPYGDLRVYQHSDKPSSLLFLDGQLIMPLHYPPGEPTQGYLAYSDDYGRTWTQVEGSPWGEESPFKVLMFINMGQAYGLNRDGYVYALGIGDEIASPPQRQEIYLARAPVDQVLDYDAYRYFAGLQPGGAPIWSAQESEAAPLPGLYTLAQGAAMYHPGLDRFLFLSGFVGTLDNGDPAGALFEAPTPWGPWHQVDRFPAGYIPGLIPKATGPDSFYFTAAGGGPVNYNLNVGQITVTRRTPSDLYLPLILAETRKREQIVGDIDFETLQPTRQRTESRFNVAFTDLGSPFEHKGKLWLLFGDTDPEAPGWDEWHDDTIAFTDAESIEDFSLTFLTDPSRPRGLVNPVIACPREGDDDCVDLGALNVPVTGLSDGESMFVWFTTDAAGRSLLARSDDDGRTFRKVYDFGDTHFIDVFAQGYDGPIPGLVGPGPWVLVFGSGDQEHNQVYLAAAPLQSLRNGDRAAVRFLADIDFRPDGTARLSWSEQEGDAAPLFPIEHGPGIGIMSEVPHEWGFGEPLVHYNPVLEKWVATYNAGRQTIRLRMADAPWGPWSASLVLFDPAADYGRGPAYGRYIGDDRTEHLGGQGELYGPYVLPRFTRRLPDGRIKLYWLLSPWQPYVVYLMESTLVPVPPVASPS